MSDTGKVLALMPTFRCNAECEHCGTISSPRADMSLPEDQLLGLIDQASELGFRSVVFTGGEATLAGDVLLRGIRRASSRRMGVRLVTNAQWARDQASAEDLLYEWMFAGLTEISISTGDQHARFVPLDFVLRAARVAASLQLPVAVTVENHERSFVTVGEIAAALDGVPVKIVSSNWMDLRPFPTLPGDAAMHASATEWVGCADALSVFTVQANGIISPCCGIGIRVTRELQVGMAGKDTLRDTVARAEASPVLRDLREHGPERLLAQVAPAAGWEHRYAHRCHACIGLFKQLRESGTVVQLRSRDSGGQA